MTAAENIVIDTEEGRFVLVIETDDGNRRTIDIHGIALDFYANVKAEIGPYAAEAESARRAVAAGMSRDEYLDTCYALDHPQPVFTRPVSVEDAIDAGYALDDPKAPGFHERMVD